MTPFDHLSSLLQKQHINRFVVAVSGGADSVAMAKLVVQYGQSNHSVIHALIVDHKLRKESTEEAAYVGRLCEELGLPYTILTWEHPHITKRLQESARNARYQLMAHWCQTHHFQYLLTAHHANDLLETFMMRLFRGSSLKGLCALTPMRHLYGITLVRPFLSVKREDLFAVLGDQSYVQDPSNENMQFERVRVRKWLSVTCHSREGGNPEDRSAPLGRLFQGDDNMGGFIKSYKKLQHADALIKKLADAFVQQHIRHKDIDLAPLLALDPLIFERVMKDYVVEGFVEEAAIEKLREVLNGQQTTTLNHKKFSIINGEIVRISSEDGRNDGI